MVSMATGSKLQLEPGSMQELLYDVGIGMAVGAAHSLYLVGRWWFLHAIQPVWSRIRKHGGASLQISRNNSIRRRDHDDDDIRVNNRTLKVVGVGYGRTGTYSLKLALDELGFPTLHTQHLYEHPEIINMWTNDIVLPSIRAKTTIMGHPNYQLIADHGFQATADFPMALYFEQIAAEFPDCKFILTQRTNAEEWFRSWDALARSITEPTNFGAFWFSDARQYSQYLRWLFAVVNRDDSYLTAPLPLPHQDPAAAAEGYEAHNARVRAAIPAHRLLEYSVRQGWEPLCSFLEIGRCPATPFPKTNSALSVRAQAISAFLFPLLVVLLVIFYGFATAFQKATGMTVMQWTQWKSRELSYKLRQVLIGDGFHSSQGNETSGWVAPPHELRKKS